MALGAELEELHAPLARQGGGGGGELLRVRLLGLEGRPGDAAVERHAERAGGLREVVDFTLFGKRFQAISAGPHHEFNDAISIVVQCDDQAELDRYWDALLEGGGKAQACGWLMLWSSLADRSRRPGRDDGRQGSGSGEALAGVRRFDVPEYPNSLRFLADRP